MPHSTHSGTDSSNTGVQPMHSTHIGTGSSSAGTPAPHSTHSDTHFLLYYYPGYLNIKGSVSG